jgi:antitoxin ParD1/3/4
MQSRSSCSPFVLTYTNKYYNVILHQHCGGYIMQKNTSVTIGAHYEKFISQQVVQGRFSSASEAIRAGLRLLEERETKLSLLRRALIEGEESGTAEYSLKGLINEIDGEGLK